MTLISTLARTAPVMGFCALVSAAAVPAYANSESGMHISGFDREWFSTSRAASNQKTISAYGVVATENDETRSTEADQGNASERWALRMEAWRSERAERREERAKERSENRKVRDAKRAEATAKREARRAEMKEKREARLSALREKREIRRKKDGKPGVEFRFGNKNGSQKIAKKKTAKTGLNGLIEKYARQHGVPYALGRAVVQVESTFRPNVTGGAGEIGLMQIKLSTARMMGYKGSRKALYDPATNLYWGMKYLGKAHQLAGGSTCGTILRYNAGHGAKRMNPISSKYCGKVKRILA